MDHMRTGAKSGVNLRQPRPSKQHRSKDPLNFCFSETSLVVENDCSFCYSLKGFKYYAYNPISSLSNWFALVRITVVHTTFIGISNMNELESPLLANVEIVLDSSFMTFSIGLDAFRGFMIVCLYVDDLILIGNNENMFDEFKRMMAQEFEMTDIGLMSYYLGIEVKQNGDNIFIFQEAYAKKFLERFKMQNCNPVSTPIGCGTKMPKYDESTKVDPFLYRQLVGSLRYLTCTRLDILYGVGLVSRYMEAPTLTHLEIAKMILCYIKGTIDYGLTYSSSTNFKLHGYSDSDWPSDINDQKSTTGFLFFIGNTAFTWCSKKQPIVTLSTCEAEYVSAASCVCHAIWLEIIGDASYASK
ncbi:uncharacterized protein LOC111397630 [Olea europaea var. sylvestris]|uniref:uncharacterized protein LOC111397630 n=1 Tax=Olea europaea var. sylvestris TaxID=158386 RepID=UPI000C1CD7FF|nr:uncharacterized protein LOC111397630 [Olea europaea var. sylvestris]